MATKTRESISVAMRFYIMRRDNFTCQYCGAKAPDAALHVEHMTPVVDGGTNDPGNLCAACVRCNLGKGTQAAASDDDRPFTAREKKLLTYHSWFHDYGEIWKWASEVYCGEDATIRLVLFGLAQRADPFGTAVISIEDLARQLHLPTADVVAIVRGLASVGLVDEYEHGLTPVSEETGIGLAWRDRRLESDDHIPVRTLAGYWGRDIPTVARVYG